MELVTMGTLLIYFLSCLCLAILSVLFNFFKKLWWSPLCIQSMLRSQGIKGPSYRFLHGSTKEILKMKNIAMSSPMEISHEFFPRVQPHIYSWIKLYGKNFLIWYGARAQLVVTEPELIKEILNSKDGSFAKIDPPVYMKKLFGDGILATRGEKWFNLRKISNHAFHAECLKGMIPTMIESVEVMLERWRHHEGKEIEVFQEFKVLTSEIISRTAFGSSYLEGQHIFDTLARMVHIMAKNDHNIRIPGIGKLLKMGDDNESDKLGQGIRNSIINMIKKREEEAMAGKSDGFGSDFLGLLLMAHHNADKNKRLSVEEMIDECKTFYVAGQETTNSSLAWTVLLLAIHIDWQDKARKEVVNIFGQQNPSPEGLTGLKILSMIVNESLRLYSPVLNVLREVQREVGLGKLILPKSMELNIPILAVHHNPEIWGEDVLLFRPERFADGVARATNNNMAAFLPFGMGPRSCVGLNFAVTEIKIALLMILQRYRFSLSPSYVHSPVHPLTMCPKYGLQVMLQAL